MTRKPLGGSHFCAGLIAAIGIIGVTAPPVIAQQSDEIQVEEIVVEAPYLRRRVVGQNEYGAEEELIELTLRVNYGDLDLGKPEDVAELEARIEATAKDACDKLDQMYPSFPSEKERYGSERCVKRAINGTEEQLQAAIAAMNR